MDESINSTNISETDDRREIIKQKLRQCYDGRIVRKDLTKSIREGANVPVYVLEYLLGQYCNSDDSEIINAPLFSDAVEIGRKVLDAYEAGEVGEIYLAYTSFKNTVVHTPEFIKLLPVEVKEEESADKKSEAPMNYEPEAEESLDLLIPKYINSIVYGAFIEAVASENGARMQAMDAATSNAEDMISTLSLAYNRARQGAITQELTEIISGAEALN